MGNALDLSERLPVPIEELRVLNLGAGYCASPISCQLVVLTFQQLTNVEVWPQAFVKLQSLHFNTPVVDNRLEKVEDYIFSNDLKDAFDVILLLDVLEHFEKEQARRILSRCRAIAKRVVLFLPIGQCAQDALDGNPYQTHLSTWHVRDFDRAKVEHLPSFHTHFSPPVDAAWVIYEHS